MTGSREEAGVGASSLGEERRWRGGHLGPRRSGRGDGAGGGGVREVDPVKAGGGRWRGGTEASREEERERRRSG